MMNNAQHTNSQQRFKLFEASDGQNYLLPFVLVTMLFFLWGFAHSILDVLNKHFQESMQVSKTESALVQVVVYGGYFLMALPAGWIIRHKGYRTGVLTGLFLYGTGALLFIPGASLLSFPFFLFSLFVIGCGLTCLETAANPYVTVLGYPDGAARRINLSQAFNGLGWVCGPLVGGWFLFSEQGGAANIARPYVLVGIIVMLVALLFTRVKLPEVRVDAPAMTDERPSKLPLWKHRNFVGGLAAVFLYVAAQTGINSFFINYVTENASFSNADAALLLSFGGMGLFMFGRMGGSWVMSRISGERLMQMASLGAALAMLVLMSGAGTWGVVAFFVCYLCESVMFPTLFALSLRGLGSHIQTASSLLIMCIVGGAVAPLFMGYIADTYSTALAFAIPLFCFIGIALYAGRYRSLLAQHA